MKKIRICSIAVLLSISFLLCCKFTDARDTYSCDLTSDMYNEIVNLVKNECKQGNKYLVERAYVANRIDVEKYVNNETTELKKCIKERIIKVPFQGADGTYGLAIFSKNKESSKYEFLGERYDCIDTLDFVQKNEHDIEEVIEDRHQKCHDIQYYEIEENDLSIVSILTNRDYVYIYNQGDENLIKSDGNVELMSKERMYQISKTALNNQTVKRTNSLSGGMAFENKKEKNVSNLLLVLGLLCILFVVILFVKKNRVKKFYVINVVMFVVILFFFGYHYKNYGVKEITYPMIKGQNKIKDSKEIQKIMDVLDLGALDEIPYKKSLDPGQKSGKNNVLKIIMNDNKEMLVVSDENYVVIRKEGEVHLYKKNID